MREQRAHLRLVEDPDEGAEHVAPVDLDAAFRRYSPYVAAIGLRLLGRDDEVDDLVQEVFVRAVRRIATLRDPDSLKAWLATVAVRVARRKLRMRRVRTFLHLDESRSYEGVSSSPDAERRALLARVYVVLDSLPTDQRLAWSLRYIEGEQLTDVAELCGCSLATAKRRIAAAQLQIRKVMNDG